jgi:FkbM family methyltransferase
VNAAQQVLSPVAAVPPTLREAAGRQAHAVMDSIEVTEGDRRLRTYSTPTRETLSRILFLDAPLFERVGLIRIGLARKLGRRAHRLRIGDTTLYLRADEADVDWQTILGIFVDGEYGRDYETATVIDLGAHKGFFGAYALARGASSVTSYEPSSDNFCFLEESVRSARGPWRAVRAAVARKDGQCALLHTGVSWSNRIIAEDADRSAGSCIERVPAHSLATILANCEEANDRVVVKMDIEGAECEVILTTPAEALSRVSKLFVEVHRGGSCTVDELAAHLRGAGLSCMSQTAPDVFVFSRNG